MGGGGGCQCLLTRNGSHRTFEGFPEWWGVDGVWGVKGSEAGEAQFAGNFPGGLV